MIYDHIRNISLYKGLSPALDTGIDYILDNNKCLDNGVSILKNGVKSIISEYVTKEENENGFEAHRQYIDIQFPVYGLEIIKCCPIEFLVPKSEYNEEKDFILFSDHKGASLTIGNGYFLILFPSDGHMPQLCVEHPEMIKKITLKVPVK